MGADLVRLQVDVIVTLAPQATLAAKQATQSIPIVFVAMGDPIASGIVPSLARPGANLTGTTRMISEMSAKHVELLKEAVPSLARLAVLWNPTNSSHRPALQAVDAPPDRCHSKFTRWKCAQPPTSTESSLRSSGKEPTAFSSS